MTALGRSSNGIENQITVVGDILEKQSKNIDEKDKVMFTMREKMTTLEKRLETNREKMIIKIQQKKALLI